VNITLEEEINNRELELELESNRDSNRAMVGQQTQVNDLEAQQDKKNESFEVPEFLYKFSSTFFKRATAKERENSKNRNKIFSSSKDNIEIQTLKSSKKRKRISHFNLHQRSKSSLSQKSGISLKSFKKVDVSEDNLSVKLNEDRLNTGKKRKGHAR
jgi:hypothetical protein